MGEMNREAGYKRSLADISPVRPKIVESNSDNLQGNDQDSTINRGSYPYAFKRELAMAGYNPAEIMIAFTRELVGNMEPISLSPGKAQSLENS